MTKVFLSIIVPAYNVEKYLNKCINSILSQDTDDYEVIIVNDCSTDSTLEIAKSFCDKKISIINKKTNTGLSDTRNTGLKYAKGKYIMFVDSDDYLSKNSLKKIIDFTDKYNPDIVYMKYNLVRNEVVERKEHFFSESNKVYSASEFFKHELSNRVLPIAACFAIYKKSFLDNNNLKFQEGYLHEDELWTPLCLLRSRTVGTLDCYFYNYVIREGSITQKKDKTKNGRDLLEISKMLDYEVKSVSDPELKKLLKNHIAMIYMKAVSRGNLWGTIDKKNISRVFPINRACFFKDRLKSVLFFFTPYLYCKLDRKYGNNI